MTRKSFSRTARTARTALFLLLLVSPTCVWAGGGPENLLVIVNPRSPGSLHIANYYASLRQIPADNLLFVPWDPKVDTTDVGTFRNQILLPILRTIHSRRLAGQIDAIVYSSDFPWRITLDEDVRKFLPDPEVGKYLDDLRRLTQTQAKPGEKPLWNKGEWSPLLGWCASINGLTYLWHPVIGRSFNYVYLESNYYMRLPTADKRDVQTVGFRGSRLYNAKGQVVEAAGRRYFLSTMLGVTVGRGNSLGEVLKYLQRSAAADGTHPKGTIYFVQNSDVRSKVRHDFFPQAVRDLTKLGVAAEILQGTVPLNRRDVQGVVMGTATFDWKASGSTILPGAICEHFTSYGGIMTSTYGQTPLSEFLRYGAAGASGAVAEPYTLPFKFPLPLIQVHYARGCTLAEAFYQSVYAPYQLLIVGDPLCRPWADIPQVSLKGVEPGATVRGRLTLDPSATLPKGVAVSRFELFADGVRMAACQPGETLSLDTTALPDGWHELRVVAIGPPPIESQGRRIIPVRLANHGRKIEASLVGDGPWQSDKLMMIAVDSPGSIGVMAMHGSRVVGRIVGEKGRIDIPANTLGAGPVRLRVIGMGKGGANTNVAATPILLTLQQAIMMHDHFMRIALEEAELALRENEVPVGAVIVHEGRVIARAHNQREQLRDPTAHAEMVAITQAAESRQSWRLDGCTLYVTLEPCPMCAGAILQARIPSLVYGATDPKAGAVDTLFRLLDDSRLNHRVESLSGVLAPACGEILSRFFQEQRRLGKK